MVEKSDPLPEEIMKYERFINDLLNNTNHPVHNRAHPAHKESVKALDDMVKRLDAMRNEWLSKS